MSLELIIALIALGLGGGALAYSILRPNINGTRIDQLQKQLGELQLKYQTVITETLRLTGENIWLKNLLIKAGIDIPPTPEYLRPHVDEQGNITIVVNRDAWGGVTMTGGKMDVGQDVVGGGKGGAE